MKMSSSTIKIVGLTITASILLLLVVVVVVVSLVLSGEVAVAVTVATTSDYDISSSSSGSSSSSRRRHDDSSGGTISLVHRNENKSRINSKKNKNRDNLNSNPNSNPFIFIEPLQFLRQDFDYSSGDDKDDSSSSYGKVSTTGVTVFDINQDGYQDIFYSAGRHSMDQSYVIMNLGPMYNSEKKFIKYHFSNPLKLGPRNGYFQIDVLNGTKFEGIIEKNHTGVLLVGGNCVITKKEKKNGDTLCPYDGYNTPSILLDVNVSSTERGCSAIVPVPKNTNNNSNKTATESASVSTECHKYKLDWKIIWTDLYPRQYSGGDSGDRNGAFVSTVTSSTDPPAIVLQGVDGIKIYEARIKKPIIKKIDNETTAEEIYYYEYGNSPTYHIPTTKIPIAKNKQRNDNNNKNKDDGVHHHHQNKQYYYQNINRFTGLAHGYVGTEPGFVSGPRTGSRTFPDEGPAPPLVVVVKDSETGQYKHYEFGYNENTYNGNSSLALQPTGLALSDLNGDGSIDVLQTSFLYENEILSDYPLPQSYYVFPNTTSASSRKSNDYRAIIKSNGNSNSNKNFSSQQRQQLGMYDGDGNNNNNGIKKSSSIHNNNITKTTFDSLVSGGRSIATGNIYNASPYNDIVLGTSARTITKSNSNSNSNSNTTTGTGTASNGHNTNNSTIIIPATVRLYANMGVDVKSNIFLGFQFVQELVIAGNSSGSLVTKNDNKNNNLDLDCSIRDITVSSLQPPSSSASTSSSKIISIITAIDCNSESGSNQEFGNVMFHAIIDD